MTVYRDTVTTSEVVMALSFAAAMAAWVFAKVWQLNESIYDRKRKRCR